MDTKPEHRRRETTAKGEKEEEEDKAAASLPPPPSSSAAASPSHEFSFTISFQPPPLSSSANTLSLKSSHKTVTTAAAVDLAPADDIFLHGHLLPLRLLSHPPSPPRPSDITFENLSLPLDHVGSGRCLKYDDHGGGDVDLHRHDVDAAAGKMKERAPAKAKTLASFFGGFARLRRRNGSGGGGGEKEDDEKKKKNKGFDVMMTRLLRKYASLMEALLFFKGESKEKRDLRRRPYSFSGHSNRRELQAEGWRRRKGQYSAPASTQTSPTNSGLLSAASMTFSSSDNSSMEELQSAIQAAIAHCKNSIASKQRERGET